MVPDLPKALCSCKSCDGHDSFSNLYTLEDEDNKDPSKHQGLSNEQHGVISPGDLNPQKQCYENLKSH